MTAPNGKTAPSLKGEGRNGNGTFAKGKYKGGPGNPWAALTHKLKSAIQKASEELDPASQRPRMEALAEELWTMALTPGGEDDKTRSAQRWAMQQILDRHLGKPKEHLEIETVFTLADAAKRLREARLVPTSN